MKINIEIVVFHFEFEKFVKISVNILSLNFITIFAHFYLIEAHYLPS